jgi:hypothetical protein
MMHVICLGCFSKLRPGRAPSPMQHAKSETCCFCAGVTRDGIFVRAAPAEPCYCQCERKRDEERGWP